MHEQLTYKYEFGQQIFKIQMGGKSSKEEDWVNPNDFEEIPRKREDDHEFAGDEYTVVRNRMDGMVYDRYHVTFQSEHDFQYYTESMKFRRNEDNIVRAYHLVPMHKKEFCSTHYAADVYLQHCRARISQYSDIPYPDNLYCMLAMLNGYQKLSDKVGWFPVSEGQVLIDENGEVRVWINADFYKNIPEETSQDYMRGAAHRTWEEEKFEMVDKIINLVLGNCDDNDAPQIHFGDFYQREKINFNNRVGFEEAKEIIVEYAQHVNLRIPDCFESVLEIYKENQEEEALLYSDGDILQGRFQGAQGNQQRLTGKSQQEGSNFIARNSSQNNMGFVNSEYQPPQTNTARNQQFSNPSFAPGIISASNLNSNRNYQSANFSHSQQANYHQSPGHFNPPTFHQQSAPIYRNQHVRVNQGPPPQNFRPFPQGNSVVTVTPPPKMPFSARIPAGPQLHGPFIQGPHFSHRTFTTPIYQQPQIISRLAPLIQPNPLLNKQIPPQLQNHTLKKDSEDLSPRERQQIENNVILKGSANIYNINQQKIINDLNQYRRQESGRVGDKETSKINIENYNDSLENQNEYYEEEGEQRILSEGQIEEELEAESRRRRVEKAGEGSYNDDEDNVDHEQRDSYYQQKRKRQQLNLQEREREYIRDSDEGDDEQPQDYHGQQYQNHQQHYQVYSNSNLNQDQHYQTNSSGNLYYEHQHRNAHIGIPQYQVQQQRVPTNQGLMMPQGANYGQQQQQQQVHSGMNIIISNNRISSDNSIQNKQLAHQFSQQRQNMHTLVTPQQHGHLFSGPLNYSTSSNMEQDLIRQSVLKKQFYYTLNNQIEIDPEIAADLYLFASAGSVVV